MKIRPLGNRVLVKRAEAEKTSKGGIIIPDNAKNLPTEGTVLAVGPGTPCEDAEGNEVYRPLDVEVGDRVIFLKYIGTEIKGPEGEPLVMLHESDLLAVYDKELPATA